VMQNGRIRSVRGGSYDRPGRGIIAINMTSEGYSCLAQGPFIRLL
jgi:hypothetical protein